MVDDGGTLNVSAPAGGGSGQPTGGNGNNGGHNDNGGNSSSSNGIVSVAFGVAVPMAPFGSTWGVSLPKLAEIANTVKNFLATFEAGLLAAGEAAVTSPLLARTSVFIGALYPTPVGLAKVTPDVSRLAFTAMPADKMLSSPVTNLPTQPATVQVKGRITDEVSDGKQHLAISGISGRPQSVPVVDAKPTNKPGVYSAAVVPGVSPMNISISNGQPTSSKSSDGPFSSGVQSFSAQRSGITGGSGTHDAVVRFPPESGVPPIYVSLTDVLSEPEIRKREEREKERQAAWDAAYPADVAQRELDTADKDLKSTDAEINRLQGEIEKNKKSVESYKTMLSLPVKDAMFRNTARIGYESAVERLAENESLLATAFETRKAKEKKKKDAEAKLDAENKKPRKGLKEYGHDYIPAPKTEEIKGLGELTRAPKRTPKQGGGGLRDRWKGDKGRKIYEWDSQHGELEGYRSSDGEHIGAFDPKTGKSVKDPDPKKNIKQYL